jgi:hypothetical protein
VEWGSRAYDSQPQTTQDNLSYRGYLAAQWQLPGVQPRYPAGRRCPSCHCYLATDNPGPLCSPCHRTVIIAEIRGAIAEAEARPARVVHPQPPLDDQVDALLRALADGPKTTRDLEVALCLSGHRVTRWKRLHRCIAELEGHGHRVAVPVPGRGGCYRLRSTRKVPARSPAVNRRDLP